MYLLSREGVTRKIIKKKHTRALEKRLLGPFKYNGEQSASDKPR